MKNVVWLLLIGGIAQASDDLDGLLGCWSGEGQSSFEAWTKTEDGDLLGFGISWDYGGKTLWETLRIRREDDSTVLTAYPGGAPGTAFRLVTIEAGYARFENPEHDFPQVIEYRWTETTLDARVSTLENDEAFELAKTRCETSD